MSYRVLVRDGPRVARHRAGTLEEALDLVERESRALASGPGRRAVRLRTREFAPRQQVAGRVELSGPGVRAGVDVRGDGAVEAWTGRIRRRLVEPRERETAYAALRRQILSVEP